VTYAALSASGADDPLVLDAVASIFSQIAAMKAARPTSRTAPLSTVTACGSHARWQPVRLRYASTTAANRDRLNGHPGSAGAPTFLRAVSHISKGRK